MAQADPYQAGQAIGYVVGAVCCIGILIAAIVVPIVLLVRKKKKDNSGN